MGLQALNLLPEDQILDRSKLKQSAGDNFKFDENSRKFSKRVENTVGKEEIACYEQFLLFPQCFQKACFPGASKGVIVWEWVNKKKSLISLKEKENNPGIGILFFFTQCILPYQVQIP